MTDPVYVKLRYTELELLLMKKLKEAHKALDTIANRDYYTNAKPTFSGSSMYDYAESAGQMLGDCEMYAQNIADGLFDDFDDEEYDVLSQS